MPLPWVRLDTAFPYNPKLLAMLQEKDGHRAALVYLCGLSYSGAHGTDGFIPHEALPYIHGRPADVKLLMEYGFWQPSSYVTRDADRYAEQGANVTDVTPRYVTRDADLPFSTGGGWLINGWDEFQESNEETRQRRIRAQAAAMARWNGHEAQTPAERQKRYRERRKTQGK